MFGQFETVLRPFRPKANDTHLSMKISNSGESYMPDRWTCGEDKPALSQVRAYEDGLWIENKIFIDQRNGESFEADVPTKFSNKFRELSGVMPGKRIGEMTAIPSERYEKWEVWPTRETPSLECACGASLTFTFALVKFEGQEANTGAIITSHTINNAQEGTEFWVWEYSLDDKPKKNKQWASICSRKLDTIVKRALGRR
jgi:hypothetical protein